MTTRRHPVWLFDLDNTLHDASHAAFGGINRGMTAYIVSELGLTEPEADALRRRYWQRYGATLLGLVRHHGVKARALPARDARLPGLEARVRGHRHDLAALARLPGRKVLLTNAPAAYTARVLGVLGIGTCSTADHPSRTCACSATCARSPTRACCAGWPRGCSVPPARCVLVEDTLGHLKAARSIGMGTVWMRRFTRAPPGAWRHRRR